MELISLRDLLDHQSGVVSRHQLTEHGAAPHDLKRWLRRREIVRVYDGVFLNHTGPPTWSSQAWASVLVHWPAALTHSSAVHLAGQPLHVAVDASRQVRPLPGIRVHRLLNLEDRVQWNLGPPRVRLEDAVISLASAAPTRVDALSILSDVCQRRRTTPQRLMLELEQRPRVQHRGWLLDVLEEVRSGIHSVLEGSYLRRVERAHGLPRGVRQLSESTEDGRVYRDVHYERYRLFVELDGRIGHEAVRDRAADLDRDLLGAAGEELTVRLGWFQVEHRPCRTADRLARVFQARGWPGRPTACGPDCVLRTADAG